MGKILNKADIFAKKALDAQSVSIDEWGGDVRFKPMSMVERREVRKRASSQRTNDAGDITLVVDQECLEIWAVITCTLEAEGDKFMFNPDDFDALEAMPAGPLTELAHAILRASGLMSDALAKSKESAKK